MIVIVQAGKIIMYSDTGNPAPGVGQERVALTDEQAAQLRAATATRNDGLLYDGVAVSAIPAGLIVDPAAR